MQIPHGGVTSAALLWPMIELERAPRQPGKMAEDIVAADGPRKGAVGFGGFGETVVVQNTVPPNPPTR